MGITVHMTGNLTRDAEVLTFGEERALIKFSLATNTWVGKDKEDEVCYLDCDKWGHANACNNTAQFMTKGRQVYVTGRLRLEQFTDKNGAERKKHTLLVSQGGLELIGGRGDESTKPAATAATAAVGDGDIPF